MVSSCKLHNRKKRLRKNFTSSIFKQDWKIGDFFGPFGSSIFEF